MAENQQLERVRRRQILDAAQSVFANRGIDKARMDDIVKASGLAKGTLYWYFKSKEAIVNAIIDRFFAGEMKRAESLLTADGAASERIKKFLGLAIQEIRRMEPLMPLGYEIFSLVARKKYVREQIQGYYQQYIELLAELIRQGVETGELRAVDPNEAALAAGGLVEGVALYWFIDPESVDWDRMESVMFSLLERGLLAPEQ